MDKDIFFPKSQLSKMSCSSHSENAHIKLSGIQSWFGGLAPLGRYAFFYLLDVEICPKLTPGAGPPGTVPLFGCTAMMSPPLWGALEHLEHRQLHQWRLCLAKSYPNGPRNGARKSFGQMSPKNIDENVSFTHYSLCLSHVKRFNKSISSWIGFGYLIQRKMQVLKKPLQKHIIASSNTNLEAPKVTPFAIWSQIL